MSAVANPNERETLLLEAKNAGTMIHKELPFHLLKSSEENGTGIVECIASVFDVEDSYGDIVKAGAFTDTLKNGRTKAVLWMHMRALLCGHISDARELAPGHPDLPIGIRDKGGLWCQLKFNLNVQRGKEAYEHIKAGDISEFSIGYYLLKYEMIVDEKEGSVTFNLLEIDLVEVSPVIRGANPDTAITAVKSGMTMDEQISAALAAVEAVCVRQAAIKAGRETDGRKLSEKRKETLKELAAKLTALTEDTEPEAKDEPPAAKTKTISALQLSQLMHRRNKK